MLNKHIDETVITLNWYRDRGIQYGPGILIFDKYDESHLPSFVEIKYLLQNDENGDIKLLCKQWSTKGFDAHMWSWWIVQESCDLVERSAGSIVRSPCTNKYISRNGKTYVMFAD